jgi:Domain of unknown function (DUF4174)
MHAPPRRHVLRSLIGIAALAGLTQPTAAIPAYQWKKRALLIFAPSASDARLTRMKSMIGGNRTALLDRDLSVVYVIGGELSHDLGPPPGMNAAAVRTLYRASEGAFRVLLLGKDGGIKMDSPAPISAADLTGEIDRMPMRRDELRKRSSDRP